MTRTMVYLITFLIGCCMFLPSCKFEKEESFEATGYIRSSVAIGGETTGWVIELDEAVNLEGSIYRRIDVESSSIDFAIYKDNHVEVKGEIEWRDGIERGRYPVLHVVEIKRLR